MPKQGKTPKKKSKEKTPQKSGESEYPEMDQEEFNRLFQNAIEQSQAQLQQTHEEQIKRLETDREAKIKVVEERLTRKFDDEVRELNRAFEESRGANPTTKDTTWMRKIMEEAVVAANNASLHTQKPYIPNRFFDAHKQHDIFIFHGLSVSILVALKAAYVNMHRGESIGDDVELHGMQFAAKCNTLMAKQTVHPDIPNEAKLQAHATYVESDESDDKSSNSSSQFVGTLTELENKLLLETARKMKLEDVRNSFRQNVIPDDMEHISSIDLLSRNNKGRPLHSKLAAIIFRLLEAKIPEFKRENFNSIQINYNAPMKKHKSTTV